MTASTSPSPSGQEDRWFGFQPVDPHQKSSLVKHVFDRVAGRYDLMNDLMSMGIHRLWKASLIRQINPQPGQLLLDVAGGTGDIALAFLNKSNRPDSPSAHAYVCDINESMLRVGRDKALDKGYVKGITWIVGDGEKLPLPDRSMDIYTIAFGLRNITHIDQALAEAYRVLRPGGRFYCLEFSHVVLPILDRIYDTYSFHILPWLGEWVAKDRAAYTYLVESIRQFPDQATLAKRMNAVGFYNSQWRNLSGGIAAIHSAWRV